MPEEWRTHLVRFTNVPCALTALTAWRGWPRDAWHWRLGACLAVHVFVGFHAARALDATAFRRMRARSGMSTVAFHAGNLGMHVLPVALALARPPAALTALDACAAHVLFAAWGLWVSGGTMRFDAIYVGLAPAVWHAAQAAALAAMLLYAHAVGSVCH